MPSRGFQEGATSCNSLDSNLRETYPYKNFRGGTYLTRIVNKITFYRKFRSKKHKFWILQHCLFCNFIIFSKRFGIVLGPLPYHSFIWHGIITCTTKVWNCSCFFVKQQCILWIFYEILKYLTQGQFFNIKWKHSFFKAPTLFFCHARVANLNNTLVTLLLSWGCLICLFHSLTSRFWWVWLKTVLDPDNPAVLYV